ncbi:hypothetical protein RND81_13G165700 [Saponaria officinalis]|uniref:Uncharacterized protein n=1 Tax=Saponaria officinalis TaxID=3572 RepID=A0AAW1GYU2_SAPOF
MSSFEFHRSRKQGYVLNVSFRLFNEDHRMSLGTFADLFKLKHKDIPIESPDHYNPRSTWNAIAHCSFDDWNHVPTQLIHYPAIRIWQRFMGWTYLGRNEPNSIRQLEVEILGSFLNVDGDASWSINLPYHFAVHLTKQSNVSTRFIVLGGLITRVAHKLCGFNQETTEMQDLLPMGEKGIGIDYEYLESLHWFRTAHPHMIWKVDGHDILSLPEDASKLKKLVHTKPRKEGDPFERPSYLLDLGPITPNNPPMTRERGESSHSRHSTSSVDVTSMLQDLLLNFNAFRDDTRLALHPIYDHYARQGVIRPEGPHPSFYNYPPGGFPPPSNPYAGTSM